MSPQESIRLALASSVAATLLPFAVQAQNPPPAEEPASVGNNSIQEVVVTATATSVRKLDASYSVVTADLEQIKQANPKSTADLLKISPGLWPESTGGQTGANIEIAGFPGGGDAPYFTVQMNGSPLYGMPTLSFLEQSSMYRLDDTIERVEIVQGGPAVVFADGQPGATANFILKRGTAEPSGTFGFTYGSENLQRADGFYGFPVAGDWTASVGGFYRISDGVRDPQFKADKGGQLTATLSRDFEAGSVMFYARYLNDKNQFITPIPLIQNGADDFSAFPGFDPLKDTYNGKAIQHVFLPTYPGGGTNADLADGRGADLHFLGANLDFEMGDGWTLTDRFLFDGGDMDTNALFSGSNPASLTDELYNIPTNLGGLALPPGSATATFVGGGAVDPNQSVIHQGWWHIHKHLMNVNNDFRISKKLFGENTLSAGVYLAYYTMSDKWSLGNQMMMTNEPNARPFTISYVGTDGLTHQRTDAQGFNDFGGFHIEQHGHALNKAFYLSDAWRIDRWLLDASARVENQNATNRVCNLTNQDLDGNPLTDYDNAVPVCNGTVADIDYDKTPVSWTVGANYELADNMSVYARYNRGHHFSDFDNGIRGNTTATVPSVQDIKNAEVGWKFQTSWLYADVTVYRKLFDGLLYRQTDRFGAPFGPQLTYGSDSKGVNVDLAVTPIQNLTVHLVGNYLDGHYSHINACFPFTNLVTGNGCAPINGQQLQRQPKVRYALQPSYTMPVPWGDVSAFVTWFHVGDHTQDQSGLQQLGTYDTLDFGVVASVGESWEVRVQGTNMTNELGLTESNSRIFGVAAGTGGVILARPLEGREVNAQVRYKF